VQSERQATLPRRPGLAGAVGGSAPRRPVRGSSPHLRPPPRHPPPRPERERALNRLRELREAVYELVIAAIRSEPPPQHAVANLERRWRQAVDAAKLAFSDRRTALTLDVKSCGLDYPTHLLALSAFELLQVLPLERTRECANPRCTWIFIDRSRGGQRRWCDMKTCGNQVKSRRYYARHG
jgi:predicted RNA-binding Zn ribbon-like protein